jgi:hypothetical protein
MKFFGGTDPGVNRRLDRIDADIESLRGECDLILERVNAILNLQHPSPTGMAIDILGGTMSTPAGGTSVFQEVPTPAGSVFPAGTTFTWSVDDTADISLTPSTDGTQVTAVCVAAPTGTSYNLTCTSSFTPTGATAPLSATLNVPIIPPVVATPTGMTINQLS